jgi:hypothetical protein
MRQYLAQVVCGFLLGLAGGRAVAHAKTTVAPYAGFIGGGENNTVSKLGDEDFKAFFWN